MMKALHRIDGAGCRPAPALARDNRAYTRERGQALVETTLALGLLMLLLLAALDMGRAFFGYVAIINAAREGARAGVMGNDENLVQTAVMQEIQGNHLDPALVTIEKDWNGSGEPLVVTVSYRFDLMIQTFLPFSQLDLRATATMMIP